jgi:hypothetical protein
MVVLLPKEFMAPVDSNVSDEDLVKDQMATREGGGSE